MTKYKLCSWIFFIYHLVVKLVNIWKDRDNLNSERAQRRSRLDEGGGWLESIGSWEWRANQRGYTSIDFEIIAGSKNQSVSVFWNDTTKAIVMRALISASSKTDSDVVFRKPKKRAEPHQCQFFEPAQPKREWWGRSSMPVLELTIMWFLENPKNGVKNRKKMN